MINNRNYGIDLLRCFSMIMIVILHMISHGGLLEKYSSSSVGYISVSFLESIVYCSVDVFAIISGYVMVTQVYKWTRIISLWLEVFFYSALLTIVLGLFEPEFLSVKVIAKTILPVLFSHYWYFTAYFGMFFFIPFMNTLLKSQYAKQLIITIIVMLSVLPTLVMQDPFTTNYGFSALWLAACYLIGGYLRLNEKTICYSMQKCFIWIGINVLICWGSKILIQIICDEIGFPESLGYYWLSYVSPIVLAIAIFWVIAMRQININSKIIRHIISWFGSGAFAVYLIHEHTLFRTLFITNSLKTLNMGNIAIEIFAVLLIAILIFAIGSSLDHLRKVFFRVAKIDKFVNKISAVVNDKMSGRWKKIE